MLDRLQALLDHFPISARLLDAGTIGQAPLPLAASQQPVLHLVNGPARVRLATGQQLAIDQPSVLLLAHAQAHALDAVERADVTWVSARLQFEAGQGSPLAEALPEPIVLPLSALYGCEAILPLLLDEAFAQRCGRQALLERLFELVIIQLLRTLMENGQIQVGLLAGMRHPRLRHALVAMHEAPAQDWSLQVLAEHAGMSRSAFADTFRSVIGNTPGHYLQAWRTRLVQQSLRRGLPLKRIASEVGYGSEAALSRVFKAQTGQSPRQWKQSLGSAAG